MSSKVKNSKTSPSTPFKQPIELIRAKALNKNTDLLDGLTGQLMVDPVTNVVGKTYERKQIEAWYAVCKQRGEPLTDPVTLQVITDEKLEPNHELRKLAEAAQKEIAGSTQLAEQILKAFVDEEPDGAGMLTSEIFAELDRVMEFNLIMKLGLKPPQIVVIGSQSSGKSSVLERLIFFCLFPRDYDLSTRCIIRVNLRRGATTLITIAQRDRATKAVIEKTKRPVALETVAREVKLMMDAIMAEPEEAGNAISLRKEIEIDISAPYCPNLNVLDVPGQVQVFHREGVTQNVPEATVQLAQSVIDEEKANSIFLLVHDARTQIDQSRAARLVLENNLQDRTVGIYTRLDIFIPDRPDRNEVLAKLKQDPTQDPYTRYGWFVCANFPIIETNQSEFNRLKVMDHEELRLLTESRWKMYADTNRAGMRIIRQAVQLLFENFLVKDWVPSLRKHLVGLFISNSDKNLRLGVPMPNDVDYEPFLSPLRKLVPTAFPKNIPGKEPAYPEYDVERALSVQDEGNIRSVLEQRIMEVCGNNHNWVKLPEFKEFWNKMNEFNTFIISKETAWKEPLPVEQALKEAFHARQRINQFLSEIIRLLINFQPKVIQNFERAIIQPELAHNEEANNRFFQNMWTVDLLRYFRLAQQPQQQDNPLAMLLKLDRFTQLMPEFVTFISQTLANRVNQKFKIPSEELVKQWNENDLQYVLTLHTLDTTNNTMKTTLSWSPMIRNYPSVLLDTFLEKILREIPKFIKDWQIPPGKLNEKCKADRLRILESMKEIIWVLNALCKLEEKVNAVRKV